nr:hypothetical protein [Micromonospora sp. DSM 115978]
MAPYGATAAPARADPVQRRTGDQRRAFVDATPPTGSDLLHTAVASQRGRVVGASVLGTTYQAG